MITLYQIYDRLSPRHAWQLICQTTDASHAAAVKERQVVIMGRFNKPVAARAQLGEVIAHAAEYGSAPDSLPSNAPVIVLWAKDAPAPLKRICTFELVPDDNLYIWQGRPDADNQDAYHYLRAHHADKLQDIDAILDASTLTPRQRLELYQKAVIVAALDAETYRRIFPPRDHMVECTFKEDKIGNLMIWRGWQNASAADKNAAAYVQNSQNITAVLDYSDLSAEDKDSLARGWAVHARLHEDMIATLEGQEL